MIIITNLKPIIGDIEMKVDNRMRNIQYFKIALNLTSNNDHHRSNIWIRLRSLNDIQVSFQVSGLSLSSFQTIINLESTNLNVLLNQ